MKRIIIALSAALLTAFFPGRAQAQFGLFPSSDVKSLGMGGVEMTTLSGSDVIYNNAALSAFGRSGAQFSALYYGNKENYYALTGAARVGRNTLLVGWRYYSFEMAGHDMSLDFGYARQLNDKWSVGATAHYMRLDNFVTPRSPIQALSVDLSAAYVLPLENIGVASSLRAGARLGNLGAYFNQSGMTLPMNLTVGAAFDTYLSDAHQITVAADVGYLFTPASMRSVQMSLGAEYNLMQMIKLRAGYHANSLDANLNYGSIGAGLQFLWMRFEFAYLFPKHGSPLRSTYGFTFGLVF